MTRKEIKAAALSNVRAYTGTSRQVNPIWLDRQVDVIVGKMCYWHNAVFHVYATDIVSGKVRYCIPGLYRIEENGCTIIDSRGNVCDLTVTDSNQYEGLSNWRTKPQTGSPKYLIGEGIKDLVLFPTPDYNVTNGLVVRGLGVISKDSWPLETSKCPIGFDWHHNTVVEGVSEQVALWLKDYPDAKRWRELFAESCGFFESQIAEYTPASRLRNPFPDAMPVGGGPLDSNFIL